MTTVGIRELKGRLSEYLDRAAAGETIVVTSRGKAKAALGPLSGEARIRQGIEEGWITPGLGGPPPLPERRYKGRMTIAEVMDEDRGD